MGNAFRKWAWTATDLSKPHESYALPRHMVSKLSLASLQAAVDAIQSQNVENIRECLSDSPPSWRIAEDEQEAAATFVDGVRMSLLEILKKGNPSIK